MQQQHSQLIQVFVGLGSNLANPSEQIREAVNAIDSIADCKIDAVSSLYGSKPMGPQDQPDYVNAVLALSTSLAPLKLLDALQTIELASGRERKEERWGPRTLDLDIILFGEQVIENARLTVPHYGMKVREFVLLPLQEIAPELTLPDGDKLSALCNNIDHNGLTKLAKITW